MLHPSTIMVGDPGRFHKNREKDKYIPKNSGVKSNNVILARAGGRE